MTEPNIMQPEFESLINQLASVDSRLQRLEKLSARVVSTLEQSRRTGSLQVQSEYFQKITQHQLSDLETLQAVADKGLSLARFGDGEMSLATDPLRGIYFQKGSFELSRSLRNVISEPRKNLLVTFPIASNAREAISVTAKFWGILRNIVSEGQVWGSTGVSRPNCFKRHGEMAVEAWTRCWEGRDVTIVTGQGSRFDLIDPLFTGVKPRYLFGPPVNAFEEIDKIRDAILAEERDLVLLSLGPAATVLAAELADEGIQALDVGHLSASYDAVFRGGEKPDRRPVVNDGS